MLAFELVAPAPLAAAAELDPHRFGRASIGPNGTQIALKGDRSGAPGMQGRDTKRTRRASLMMQLKVSAEQEGDPAAKHLGTVLTPWQAQASKEHFFWL